LQPEKPQEIKLVQPEPVRQVVVEEVKEAPMKSVRAKAPEPVQKAGYSLPPVAMKRGGMSAFDFEILKQQQEAINKLS
jgi:hypothetical protein